MRRIADERSASRLAAYTAAGDLATVARSHAAEMARQNRLHHNPRLSSEVQGWESIGENVGVGTSVDDVHQAFMASESHRHAILSSDFTEVGVGVFVAEDGRLWISQVFRRPQPAASSSPPVTAAPAPAARPAAPAAPAATATTAPPTVERASRAARTPRPAAPVPTPASVLATTAASVPDPVAVAVEEIARPDVGDPIDVEVLAASFDRWPAPSVASAISVLREDPSRRVSAPVATAAALLLLVVLGLLVEVGRYPLSLWRRQRSQASMSSSRSPSSTAWTLPVS